MLSLYGTISVLGIVRGLSKRDQMMQLAGFDRGGESTCLQSEVFRKEGDEWWLGGPLFVFLVLQLFFPFISLCPAAIPFLFNFNALLPHTHITGEEEIRLIIK